MLELMYSPEVIRREMAGGVTWELVTAPAIAGAGQADAPVGYLSFSFDEPSGTVTLHKLYLVPRLHGQGLGRSLLEHVRNAAGRFGARAIRLQVNKRNVRAIRVYERAGFVVTDAIVSDIGGGYVMDDYVMTCDLRRSRDTAQM
jgi:ribosomal protein S18 acetylase RimI-like enzyme